MRISIALFVCVIGCGKRLSPEFCAAHPDDAECMTMPPADAMDAMGSDATDAQTFAEVAHLSSATESMLTSMATLTLGATTINTSTGTANPALPGGVQVLPSVQQLVGPNVMVIQAATITISGALTVVGDKPLILVATGDIVVSDTIDAAAMAQTPGPGGSAPAAGSGLGVNGTRGSSGADAGGGGASFGTPGGAGGTGGNANGAAAGGTYGSAMTLEGGSGGGAGIGDSCSPLGGAGGGAIQLSAGRMLSLQGSIDVGGGGAQRGSSCNSDGASGAGGGSGGMIFLQAQTFVGNGMLGANGGGGGGGASSGGGTLGSAGGDATVTTGGSAGSGGSSGGNGGAGASGTTMGQNGMSNTSSGENGGGGGGGGGRIYYQTPNAAPTYASSPPAVSAS